MVTARNALGAGVGVAILVGAVAVSSSVDLHGVEGSIFVIGTVLGLLVVAASLALGPFGQRTGVRARRHAWWASTTYALGWVAFVIAGLYSFLLAGGSLLFSHGDYAPGQAPPVALFVAVAYLYLVIVASGAGVAIKAWRLGWRGAYLIPITILVLGAVLGLVRGIAF